MTHTGAAYSVSIRAQYSNLPGMLGRITSAIGNAGGDVVSVDMLSLNQGNILRQITVNSGGPEHIDKILTAVKSIPGVTIESVTDPTFQFHRGGKIEMKIKRSVTTRDDVAKVYTPGVARVCKEIHKNPDAVWDLTSVSNTVAVVSDGTAVLGLGDIGPRAAMPVMEGKALLFKKFAGVDAWPIVLSTKDPDKIVEIVTGIAPGFGGINLEDIGSPRCFYIEDQLKERLDIPVFHDDQHGTAVVVLAGLINSLKIVGKKPQDIKVTILGPGAAGTACAKAMLSYGITNIVVFDRKGALSRQRDYDKADFHKSWLAENTNPDNFNGSVSEGLKGTDFLLGVAGPNILTPQDLALMAPGAIVFVLSNPDPEILPESIPDNIRIVATGRSDYPNQVNNSLCFPGLFRGLLDVRAKTVTDGMKIAAAEAIAGVIPAELLCEDLIIPSMFDQNVYTSVASAVSQEARARNLARIGTSERKDYNLESVFR